MGNVVQIDFESRVNALRCFNDRNDANPECMLPPHSVGNLACSVLFDFAAAFPSVLQAWLLLVLKAIQAPEGFINTFTSMYSENHAYSRNQGGLVLMFKVFSGVLQGCPLSGALFNVGIDPLLWAFSRTIVQPGLGKVFACADDIGAALRSLHNLIPIAKMFNMFRKVSGLTLKPSKCVLILTSVVCSERNILAIRSWLQSNIPEWKDMNITNHGKYLGFHVGPAAGGHNWNSPIAKFKQRSREIHAAALPAAFSANEYNTKCLPTLLYVSQLCSPPPHLLQTELGAIHKVLHLPPQTFSYSLAINFSALSGFSIRSAAIAMHASMIRFSLKSFPRAKHYNDALLEATLQCVPLVFIGQEPGLTITPGWDSPAYVSLLANAVKIDNPVGDGLPEFAAYISKLKCKLDRNRSIQEIAVQKEVYNILIKSIPNGWNPLVSKRLVDFGVNSELMHDSYSYYCMQLRGLQPHLRMTFIKTVTNGWHTSSRMHEAICLPCIFGCNALPDNSLASSSTTPLSNSIRDETAHYMSCPILAGLLTQAFGFDNLITLHQLAFGNDKDDHTGVLACATSYHVYHSLKFGNLPLIQKAIETGMFGLVRAFALSSARAFMSDFGILSKGSTLGIGYSSGFKREQDSDFGHTPVPSTSRPHPAAFNSQRSDDVPLSLGVCPDL